jgi:C-terminal processing protease CtpA/Prc
VVTGDASDFANGAVDFLIAERDVALEPPGSLGMLLADEDSAVEIRKIRPGSPAASAGFVPGDRIRAIAGESVRDLQDVRLALLDRTPGEAVWVELTSGGKSGRGEKRRRSLTLM